MKVYHVPHERTSPLFAAAFAKGCGGKVVEAYAGGVWAGFGSPHNWHHLQAAIAGGHDWYFGDHAYFGRHKYYKVTKNAYFHKGEGVSNMKRIREFHTRAEKWVRGSKIIICPQSDGFFKLRHNTTQRQWVDGVIKELELHTDRRIVIHGKWDEKKLVDCLHDAHCVISHSSNSAVEALMNGVPAINLADSVAANMTRNKLSDVENLLYPENRLEWAGVLADNQWSFDEMKSGKAWRELNAKI